MRHDDLLDIRAGISLGTVLHAAILGGFAFLQFKMAMTVILGGDALTPVRSIAAIVLGEQALSPSFSVAVTLAAALSLHLVLSLLYVVVFWLVVGAVPALHHSRVTVLLTGCVMGLVLWGMNLYFFAPLFFPWFTENRPVVEGLARIVCFGLPVALVVSESRTFRVAMRSGIGTAESAARELLAIDEPRYAGND